MRIAVVMDTKISAGGGFNQALSAVQQSLRILGADHDVHVAVFDEESQRHLRRLGVAAKALPFTKADRALCRMRSLGADWVLDAKLSVRSSFEMALQRHGIDLVYFVTPSQKVQALTDTNYVLTIWDNCHRDEVAFPEVRASGVFGSRENYMKRSLPQAFGIITESRELGDALAARYGLDANRVVAMPTAPGPLLNGPGSASPEWVRNNYNVSSPFVYYPAQLWAHKNHVHVLQALAVLRERGVEISLVSSGGDFGNGDYLREVAKRLDVAHKVRFLGFVPPEHVGGLYGASTAVVMPTFFGPTNIPPLEAWSLGKPLIYSKQFSSQVGDAAILVDPCSSQDIAEAIESVMRPEVTERLVREGFRRLARIDEERTLAEKELSTLVSAFAGRRACWK